MQGYWDSVAGLLDAIALWDDDVACLSTHSV